MDIKRVCTGVSLKLGSRSFVFEAALGVREGRPGSATGEKSFFSCSPGVPLSTSLDSSAPMTLGAG
eukprot:CAMPEP_0115068290 /NCGR_PEP_ID=MMETSP0227-20121206/11887_1 /TAXON_ID=89957 /ORGANISM="Polarella glacialis, Strain CCMP 1383" /LENGTH=65 /DNA_ID=CAMNT_0002454499 /DNA_START=743 /DNA_END=936 /DNA_ORIENTATION=+